MKKQILEERKSTLELSIPAFGYELIREELLTDLLGNDAPIILYWAGKRIARNYPLFTINEIRDFFQNAGWGNLHLLEEKNNEITFELSGDLIHHRLETKVNPTFQLEAGFLAEQIQQMRKVYAETFEHPKKRNYTVTFTVKWDHIPFNE
ncbi:YslB family protein [Bacillus kwashiorkori]|uniref:YslB family protein n=1 Tax=Bacillus kwashiorkori TaxID=1522318 RepID=UPI000982081C|nr:YslB family protein [Bacillus kwashiorkori]